VASATAVLLGAVLLRLGGRAALVSLLGLDMVAELGIGDRIDEVVSYADALGPWAVVGFVGAWVVAKVFLVDFVSIALAFSSGILFGGVFEGAALSVVGATLGSLAAFGLSRSLLQQRAEVCAPAGRPHAAGPRPSAMCSPPVSCAGPHCSAQEAVEKQPVARALARVVERDGFKTVFVLRLAPIVPLPLGAYSYVYGTSRLSPLSFAAATALGSVKSTPAARHPTKSAPPQPARRCSRDPRRIDGRHT